MAGFAKAALNGETAPLNAKNWPTADNGKLNIIPTMLKSLMQGAPFASTVAAANTQLQNVLNTGSPSYFHSSDSWGAASTRFPKRCRWCLTR